ncbi:MAG: hypothetical protein KAI43_09235 [Candidatus Aureabacteria bacterium]|nr:hypothetical protein [Candidatus Auribacterota bacterium]
MKKVLLSLLVVIMFAVLASPAFAGGGKVRGDKGKGEVVQVVGPTGN